MFPVAVIDTRVNDERRRSRVSTSSSRVRLVRLSLSPRRCGTGAVTGAASAEAGTESTSGGTPESVGSAAGSPSRRGDRADVGPRDSASGAGDATGPSLAHHPLSGSVVSLAHEPPSSPRHGASETPGTSSPRATARTRAASFAANAGRALRRLEVLAQARQDRREIAVRDGEARVREARVRGEGVGATRGSSGKGAAGAAGGSSALRLGLRHPSIVGALVVGTLKHELHAPRGVENAAASPGAPRDPVSRRGSRDWRGRTGAVARTHARGRRARPCCDDGLRPTGALARAFRCSTFFR